MWLKGEAVNANALNSEPSMSTCIGPMRSCTALQEHATRCFTRMESVGQVCNPELPELYSPFAGSQKACGHWRHFRRQAGPLILDSTLIGNRVL